MGNADRHRQAHEAFNRGDIDVSVQDMSPDVEYTDCARAITMKSRDEFAAWLRDWRAGFSDATVSEATYIDAGDVSICRFRARGTNDGPFGPLPATGRRIDAPFCEIVHWDADGRGTSAEVYYDQMTLLVQLGVIDPPPPV